MKRPLLLDVFFCFNVISFSSCSFLNTFPPISNGSYLPLKFLFFSSSLSLAPKLFPSQLHLILFIFAPITSLFFLPSRFKVHNERHRVPPLFVTTSSTDGMLQSAVARRQATHIEGPTVYYLGVIDILQASDEAPFRRLLLPMPRFVVFLRGWLFPPSKYTPHLSRTILFPMIERCTVTRSAPL